MANKRTPQTLKKRQRERDKQMQRQEKIARRIERNSQKRLAKQEGPVAPEASPIPGATSDKMPMPIPAPVPVATPVPKAS